MNYIKNMIDDCLNKCKLIPLSVNPTNFYTITFEGWNKFKFEVDDEVFNKIIIMAYNTICSFIKLYEHTHAFTEPQFGFKPDGTCYIKIGTMENELYEKLYGMDQY